MEEYRRILTEFRKGKNGRFEKPDWYPHFSKNSRIEVDNNFFNFNNLNNYQLYFPHSVKSNEKTNEKNMDLYYQNKSDTLLKKHKYAVKLQYKKTYILGGKVMKRKVVKMGLAVVMSIALLSGCGNSAEKDNYLNDVKAFATLQSVDNTDLDAMSKAVEELTVNTSEAQAVKSDMEELLSIAQEAMNAASGGESIDADSLTKMQEDVQKLTEQTQTDLETFIKAAEESGVDDGDMEGLSEDLGL